MFEHYAYLEYPVASAQLAFAMVGMGALLSPSDFAGVARRPRALLVGIAVQLVGVPLLAVALGSALPVRGALVAGLVLVAAVPGGTMSNVVTYFARGNIALSISLTAVCTVGSLVTTPVLLRTLLAAELPSDFVMPTGRVATEIGVTLLLPLLAGMGIGARWRAQRGRISRYCIRASLFFIGIMVVGSAGSGRLDPASEGLLGPVAVLALAVGAQIVAVSAATIARLDPADRVAVAIEATIRNTNLGLLLKASLFPAIAGQPDPLGDGLLFVVLLYGAMALFAAAPPIAIGRRLLPAP